MGPPPPARVPFPTFASGPHSQPYAIPTRGGGPGPIGAPQVPQHGNRGFSGAGRGGASNGGTIGGHLPPHQQNSQQGGLAGIGSPFGFGDQNSQPSGAPLSQTGMMTQVCKLEVYGH